MRARDRPEGQDQDGEDRARRNRVAEKGQGAVPPGELQGHDARADDGREEKGGSDRFGRQTALEIGQRASRAVGVAPSRRPISCSFSLSGRSVKGLERKCGEHADPPMQHPVGVVEGDGDLGVVALRLGRVGDAPMGCRRTARPDRTRFAGGAVANREDEVERRRLRPRELLPRLGAQARGIVAEAAQEPDRLRVDLALGPAAGAVGPEAAIADLV